MFGFTRLGHQYKTCAKCRSKRKSPRPASHVSGTARPPNCAGIDFVEWGCWGTSKKQPYKNEKCSANRRGATVRIECCFCYLEHTIGNMGNLKCAHSFCKPCMDEWVAKASCKPLSHNHIERLYQPQN